MSKIIEQQIRKIESIADVKNQELANRNHKRYKPLYTIAFRYLEDHCRKILLYGGFALNAILPSKLRFYSKTELPDLDIFSYDARTIAHKLSKIFTDANYVSSVTPGLHDDTWKVIADGVQIADITQVSREAFSRLARGSVKVHGSIRTVSREFLRLALHIVLSQPNDARLWEKNVRRLVAFYTAFPPKSGRSCKVGESALGKIDSTLVRYLMEFVRINGFVLFGMDIDRTTSPKDLESEELRGMIHVVVEQNPMDVAKIFKEAVGDLAIVSNSMSSPHMGSYVLLLQPQTLKPWACFVMAPTCLGYSDIHGFRVASIHTVMRMYLSILLDGLDAHFDTRSILCVANVMSKQIMESIAAGTHVAKDFTLTCYGPFDGIYTLRKKRYIKHVMMEKKS